MNNFIIKIKKGSKIIFNEDTQLEVCSQKNIEKTIITLKDNPSNIILDDASNDEYIRKSIDEVIKEYQNATISMVEVDRSFGLRKRKSSYLK